MKIQEIKATISINSKINTVILRFADECGYVKETPEVFIMLDGTAYLPHTIEIKKVR